MVTDAELYEAWAAGDRKAGARLIDRYLHAIARFFANKVPSPSDADDLVASTFEQCAKSLGRLRQTTSFRSYLFGIAANVLREAIRKQRPAPVGDLEELAIRDLSPSPSAIAARHAEQRLLLAALRAIPVEHQIVLELSVFEGMSRAEMAEVLGVPQGTVSSRLNRARVLLDQRLEELAASPGLLQSTQHGLDDWARQIRDMLDGGSG